MSRRWCYSCRTKRRSLPGPTSPSTAGHSPSTGRRSRSGLDPQMNETAVPRKREPAPLLVTGLDSEPVALHDFGGEGPNLLLVHATGMHGWVFLPMAERL